LTEVVLESGKRKKKKGKEVGRWNKKREKLKEGEEKKEKWKRCGKK
jgi:hypothetical protein